MAKVHNTAEKLAYTLDEASQLVGVSTPVMAEWVRTPGFPAFRSGRRWIIPAAALVRWLEEQAAKGGSVAG